MAALKRNQKESDLQNDDDNNPQLSSHTLSLLQEFYDERDAQQKLLASLKPDQPPSSEDHGTGPLEMSFFAEDWNVSQFWYTNSTADILATALTSTSSDEASINVAVISAPSVFAGIKRLLTCQNLKINKLKLLEYDSRFSAWPEFTHYDYMSPFKLDAELRGQFDRIILDPPFLSEDCQTKAALTVRWLAKAWTSDGNIKLIICTGERMANLIDRLYGKLGVCMTDFEIQHARGLGNEFRCYANFEQPGLWKLLPNN